MLHSMVVEAVEVGRIRKALHTGLLDRAHAEVGVKRRRDLDTRLPEMLHFESDREGFTHFHGQGQLEGVGPSEVPAAMEGKFNFNALRRVHRPDQVPKAQSRKSVAGQAVSAAKPGPTDRDAPADGLPLFEHGSGAHEKNGLMPGGSPFHDMGAEQSDRAGAEVVGDIHDGESGLQLAQFYGIRQVHGAGYLSRSRMPGKISLP